MANTAIDAPREDMWRVEPERLTIVLDPKHPLYDERADPQAQGFLPLNEELVASLGELGNQVPVLVRIEGDQILVVDGRQRTRAAQAWNERVKKPERIVLLVRRVRASTERELALIMATTTMRVDDSPLVRARKMHRALTFGATEADVAKAYGVKMATVNGAIKLLDCCSAVQKALGAGLIAETLARKFAGLKVPAQLKMLAKMIDAGATRGKRAAEVVAGAKGTAQPRRSRQEILAEIDKLGALHLSPDRQLRSLMIRRALRWVLGVADVKPPSEEASK